jgi:hypothetical protein
MLIIIALLRFCPGLAVALPFQGTEANATTPSPGTSAATRQTVGWKSTPRVRGTFDLLLSCLTTLSLCAWTAYHPNVYAHRAGWKILSHRITWMLVAVLFPEVVLWCAWEQWWAAKSLERNISVLGERAFDGVGLNGHEATERRLRVRPGSCREKGASEYACEHRDRAEALDGNPTLAIVRIIKGHVHEDDSKSLTTSQNKGGDSSNTRCRVLVYEPTGLLLTQRCTFRVGLSSTASYLQNQYLR